ncbi:MAG: hypothetical protein KKE79_00120 [Actinobacteria bacterium]|nr:hypothetical protein [Actinomycetota bacterium]MBU4302347.1 hypothetical protein [Actinomycetota bacterium]MBU4385659.1 hypothetical protein [Actinomycetota bacterium]MBU4489023.1 hypothetical protein [Actinomycetota bacterium]
MSAKTLWQFVQSGKLTPSQVSGRYVLSPRMQLMFFMRNHSSEFMK